MEKADRRGRLEEWIIALALVALAVVGALTVFDDEIARLRGKPAPPAAQDPAVPISPGNTQGTL